jgi:hypothetical protein
LQQANADDRPETGRRRHRGRVFHRAMDPGSCEEIDQARVRCGLSSELHQPIIG